MKKAHPFGHFFNVNNRLSFFAGSDKTPFEIEIRLQGNIMPA